MKPLTCEKQNRTPEDDRAICRPMLNHRGKFYVKREAILASEFSLISPTDTVNGTDRLLYRAGARPPIATTIPPRGGRGSSAPLMMPGIKDMDTGGTLRNYSRHGIGMISTGSIFHELAQLHATRNR